MDKAKVSWLVHSKTRPLAPSNMEHGYLLAQWKCLPSTEGVFLVRHNSLRYPWIYSTRTRCAEVD